MLEFDKFVHCENEYRSAPFWSWNDKLDKEELFKQIHEMRAQGMGGFFMHVRGGFVDEYLGETFMDAVKACTEEASRLGMKAWLYDEDFASSGYAGGKILKIKPELAAVALEIERTAVSPVERDQDMIAIFQDPNTHGSMIFKMIRHDPAPHHDHQSYTDLCNKETVDTFIALTHQKYKEVIGSYFHDTVPGIFTDEPHFSPEPKNTIRLPWTRDFEKEFKRIKGYDIVKCLDKLLIKGEGSEKVRFDYWEVISGMFTHAYMKNIFEWCECNHLKFTGHFYEDIFPDPIRTGSVMPNYEYFHIPGIDMLFNTKEEREQFGNVLIVKEASSVGNQLNKERVLSETYGGSGWELDFEDQKKTADWLFALGINFICQHLVHYSLRGYRKRDYPLSFYAHQPWWKCYKLLGDYIGRLSYVLSQGKFLADILVLHSSASTWIAYDPAGNNDMNDEIGRSIRTLTRNLCEIQYFFDLGDELLIERHGKVEEGRFIIGQSAYTTILLPSMMMMKESSFRLLKQFAEQGGKIVLTGLAPRYMDAMESPELTRFFSCGKVYTVENNKASLKELLMRMGNLHAEIEEKDGKEPCHIYCHRRDCGDKEIFFLSNISKVESYRIILWISGRYGVEEWDACSGCRSLKKASMKEGYTCVELEFEPVASHLLILDKRFEADERGKKNPDYKITGKIMPGHWKVERQDYNAMTINRCSAALDHDKWEEEDNVLAMDDKFKDRLGLDRASIFSRQPWTFTEEIKSKSYAVTARYLFTMAENLKGELFVAAESPDIYEVTVNGKRVEPSSRTYKDRAFVLYDIRDAASPGINEVVLSTNRYGALTSLESIYIVGDFRLDKAGRGFVLTNEQQISVGDWTLQGYPYYSGSMKYSCEFNLDNEEYDRVEFEFESFMGVAAQISVNGKEAGVIGWKPYKVDITEHVRCGKNHLELSVMNSLQNLLGPHHFLPREGVVAPESFYCREDVKFMPGGFDGKGTITIQMEVRNSN